MLLFFTAYGCKKEFNNDVSNSKAVEVGEIKSHIVSLDQANKIAILQSVYPSALKKSMNGKNLLSTSSIPYVAQEQKLQKSVKSSFSVLLMMRYSQLFIL